MSNLSHLKKLIITGLCVSLCIVLPLALHAIPNAGSFLCPMHLPVLLCGLICGWLCGGLCGLIGASLSSLITGMPPVAILPSMIIELTAYGSIIGLLMKLIRTKYLYLDLYISLIVALLIGKALAGITTAFIFTTEEYSFTIWATSYFVTTLPATAIQLTLIPLIYGILIKSKSIPAKYKQQK